MKRKAAEAKKPTAQESLQYELESLEQRLRSDLASAQAAVQKLNEEMKSPFHALDRCEWLEGYAVRFAEGALAQTILTIYDNQKGKNYALPLESIVQEIVNRERDAIMSNQYRGSSTSQFHNATMGAKREAATRLCGAFGIGRRLEQIAELKQRVAAEDQVRRANEA